ncbi:F-box/RNI-like superfamily protein [Fagus crenata]
MKEGEDVMKHINIFNALINDLNRIDVQISEKDRALLLLASLPNTYEHFVTTLMFGKSTLKFNEYKALKKDPENKAEANVTSTSGVDDALIGSLESKAESWVLDSGASVHTTSSSELFTSYTPGNLGKVYLGDNQPCDVVGKGEVQIKLNGSVWKLRDVRHIPALRKKFDLSGTVG